MIVKRSTEQITDVSRGNTAAFVGIDQFLLKKDWRSESGRRCSQRSQRRETRSREDRSDFGANPGWYEW